MAIFGSLAAITTQVGAHSKFEAALKYLNEVFTPGSVANQRIQRVPEGKTERVELSGGAFALEQVYRSKARNEGIFESHRAYIDVQVIFSGSEIIEVNDIAGLALKEDRTPAQDVLLYQVPPACTQLRLGPGDAAILYPVDGHMPQIAPESPGLVRKTVIKVPVGDGR
ncbi:MAG TPA: YhcH/YjgK/YiaL family protein [Opitutaceae bacterium]|nr:YhcH/YjgK/YiaL family protein [Opitutaceae bacterium]